MIGAGPGDPGLFTLRGAEILKSADIIFYDGLVNPEILDRAFKAEKVLVGKPQNSGKLKSSNDQQAINYLLVQSARSGKQVVRLKGGDPFVFGRGGEEALFLKKNGIPFEIVPGVSAGFAVPAYAGIPVTDRKWASTVTFVTANEDPKKKQSAVDWENLAKRCGTLVLFMGVESLPKIVKALINAGKSPETLASTIEQGTLPNQRVVEGCLRDIADKVKKNRIKSPAITVIGEVNQFRKQLQWFEKKPLLGKTVLVTRPTAQAATLSAALKNVGAKVLEFPSIKILPPKDWTGLDQAIRDMRTFDWILFTSVNGVEYFMKRLFLHGKDARMLGGVKIGVIGEKTAEVLTSFGLKADLVPGKYTTEDLLKKLMEQNEITSRSFLLPRTNIAPEYLSKELCRLGAKVREAVAYETVPNLEPGKKRELEKWVENQNIDYITFTSASTVDHFFDSIPKHLKGKLNSHLISIGPITTKAIRQYGKRPYKEARKHTIPGLLEVLIHDSK